jgi:hypothetical protein
MPGIILQLLDLQLNLMRGQQVAMIPPITRCST